MAILRYKMLTAQEIREYAEEGKSIAVLPLGSIEQHGPHLPVGTDFILSEAYIERLLKKEGRGDVNYLILPSLPYTCSIEHNHFGGTIALDSVMTIQILISIGEALLRAGLKSMLILCCHGGNEFIMEVASRELRTRGMYCFCMHGSAGMSGETDPDDMHAGEGETSMMMSLGEEYYRADKINPESKDSFEKCKNLTNSRSRATQAWIVDDVAVQGVVGDPTLATKEKGEKFLDMSVKEIEKTLGIIADTVLKK
jgi:creatinine amidohydrolase